MHAIRGTTGDLVLDAKLEGMDPGKRRGRCWKKGVAGAPKECTNASGPPACNPATEGHCTEYVLEALGGTKLP
jgi:hypothetical protein